MIAAALAKLAARIDDLAKEVRLLRETLENFMRELRSEYDTKPDLKAEHARREP